MDKRITKSLHVMCCALVACALVLSVAPASQAHAATKPAKVKSVKVSQVKTTSAKVAWKKASSKSVKGYQVRVYKGTKVAKKYTVKKRTTVTKKVTGLKANTKYTVKVRAYKGSKHKVYGKWSAAKKFTTKKKATTTKPAAHVHNYNAVKHAAVWDNVTVKTVRTKETDPNLGYAPVVTQGYTGRILKTGEYSSCTDGEVKEHLHQWKEYTTTLTYTEERVNYYVCSCKEKFKYAKDIKEHFNYAYDHNLSGHTSWSLSSDNDCWIECPGGPQKVKLYACSICGEVKK